MKNTMINQNNIEIAKALGNNISPVYDAIKIDKDKSLVANRYLLLQMSKPNFDSDDFPLCFSNDNIPTNKEYFIKIDDAKKIIFPNKSYLPIIGNALATEKDDKITLFITDLSTTQQISTTQDHSFPSVKTITKVMETNEPPTLTITLNPEHLKNICNVAVKLQKSNYQKSITFNFYGSDKQCIFKASNNIQEFTGALMPIILSE